MATFSHTLPSVNPFNTFSTFYTDQPEIIALSAHNVDDFKRITCITAESGNGVSHLLHAISNFHRDDPRCLFLTTEWLEYWHKKYKATITLRLLKNLILDKELIVIDNYERSSTGLKSFIKTMVQTGTAKWVVGINEKASAVNAVQKLSSDFECINIKGPTTFNLFKILKDLCEFEPIPERVIFQLSGYIGTVQQSINCLLSLRFRTKANGIDLSQMTAQQIEVEFGIRNFFPKQQLRRSFSQYAIDFTLSQSKPIILKKVTRLGK